VHIYCARDYAHAHHTVAERHPHPTVLKFRQLVERKAAARHDLGEYAAELGLSAAHLTRLCRRHLGITAKEVVQERLEVAARRLLLFSDRSSAQIANVLGFADASYFTRFFRRRAGVTPARFRATRSAPIAP